MMTAVERLARALSRESYEAKPLANGSVSLAIDEYWDSWKIPAIELLTELQAPQRALIEKWRQQANEIKHTAGCTAALYRKLARELEKSLEGGDDQR